MRKHLFLAMILSVCNIAVGSDCTNTSVGFTPINDLDSGLYLGQFQGGLYPDGINEPPAAHAAMGVTQAGIIQPLDAAGSPNTTGRIVLISIGMSNTTQEFCSAGGGLPCDPWTFMGQAASNSLVNHSTLTIVNGAKGGQSASHWESSLDPNYDRIRDQVLGSQGLSEAQVQVAWVKVANPRPTLSLPDPAADAYDLLGRLGNIMRSLRTRYPNLRLVFLSSRIYGGYASSMLSPEPYAYESGFSVKWLIEAQINQMSGGGIDPIAGNLAPGASVPWLAWGDYLWADGLSPRSDGLTWACDDFDTDGTHPSQSGEQKVGTALLGFFLQSPFTKVWFRADGGQCLADMNHDGVVDVLDFFAFIQAFGTNAPRADINGDGLIDVLDFFAFIVVFAAGCP